MKHPFRRRLLYAGFHVLRGLARVLPLRAARAAGRGLGAAAFQLLPAQRRLTLTHLETAFGRELTARERRRLAQRVFMNLGQTAIEWLLLPALSSRQIQQLVVSEGVEHVREALARGNGAILLTAHFGNWELISIYLKGLGFEGGVLARRLRYPEYESFLIELRGQRGVPTFVRGSLKDVARLLRANQIIGVLPDQDVESLDGIFVDFFGRPAYTPVGPAALSLMTKAPLLPCFLIRAGERFRLVIEPPVPVPPDVHRAQAIATLTQAWSRVVESYIRRYPDHWVWMHRRWKTRPQTEDHRPQTSEARGQESEVRDRQSEIRGQKAEINDRGADDRTQTPGTQDAGPKTQDVSLSGGESRRAVEPTSPSTRPLASLRASPEPSRGTSRRAACLSVYCVVLSAVVGCLRSGGPSSRARGEAPDAAQATQRMSEFTLTGYEETGGKRWDLSGSEANLDGQIVTIRKPDAVGYDPERTSYLTASVAQIHQQTRQVRLEHDVTVHTSDGLWFASPILYWIPDQDRVETDAPVRIETDHMLLRGYGLTGLTPLKQATVHEDVELVLNSSDDELPGGGGPGEGSKHVVITCDGPLTVDYQRDIATFERNVHVVDPSGEIYSDTLVAYLNRTTHTIRYADAIGHVRILQAHNTATSERAVYEPLRGRITLVGRPSLLLYPDGKADATVSFGGLAATPVPAVALPAPAPPAVLPAPVPAIGPPGVPLEAPPALTAPRAADEPFDSAMPRSGRVPSPSREEATPQAVARTPATGDATESR